MYIWDLKFHAWNIGSYQYKLICPFHMCMYEYVYVLSLLLSFWSSCFLLLRTLLEKEMATHFSILAWKIPWTEEPGGLQSKGLQRVKHDWVTGHQQQQAFNIRHSAQAHQYTNAHTQIHTYSSLTWDFGCKLQNQHESDWNWL